MLKGRKRQINHAISCGGGHGQIYYRMRNPGTFFGKKLNFLLVEVPQTQLLVVALECRPIRAQVIGSYN